MADRMGDVEQATAIMDGIYGKASIKRLLGL
jgi:hypothetical protein